MSTPLQPDGHATVNPFIITDNADVLTEFLVDVFGATVRPEARTIDTDGLVLHAEVALGDTTVMMADRKPDWPFTPSLLQVYVDDITATLDSAVSSGGTLVTKPTDFFGTVFSRVKDPLGNLWWVWQHGDAEWDTTEEDSDEGSDNADSTATSWDEVSPELAYIHDSLLPAMRGLTDPQA